MDVRRFRHVWFPAALAFAALTAIALPQAHPGGGGQHVPPPIPIGHATPPVPVVTARPVPMPSVSLLPNFQYVGKVRNHEKVPLSRLPRLPLKSMTNTIHPGKHHRLGILRPMAASGATYSVDATDTSCSGGGTVGDLFNIGCDLSLQAVNMGNWSTSDTYQYYVLPPNSTTATAYGSGAECSPSSATWAYNAAPTCKGTDTTLSTQGTYAFFVYDTTKKVIPAIIYVNAGQIFTIQVYADPFHTQTSYQFDVDNSTAAYIYLQNVAPSDYYVTYVMSTGVNAYCVYMTPPGSTIPSPSPRPTGGASPGSLVCNPSTSTGLQAPGGSLAVTWPLSSSYEGGSYSVIVYDKTQNVVLGQVQVALTGTFNAAILTKGSTTGYNSFSPAPAAANPPSETQLAWDGTSDQSVGGITGTTQKSIVAGTYRWTISSPEGRALGTPAPVTNPTSTPMTNTFSFASNMQTPGNYPSANWVMQLYDTANAQIEGAQSFQLLGYHAKTRFNSTSLELTFPTLPTPTATPATLTITNDGDVVFNGAGNADSFGQGTSVPAIVVTEDLYGMLNDARTAANLQSTANTSTTGTTGGGVEFTFTNGENCVASCADPSNPVSDSAGGTWDIYDYCSKNPPINVAVRQDGCLLEFYPHTAGTVLAPGASITINLYWYAQGGNNGWSCYNTPCNLITTVLPTHGLSWSKADNPSSPTAWTPITFDSVNSAHAVFSATASFDYVNSRPAATSPPTPMPTVTPWTGAHYYEPNQTHAEYQNSTPFTANSRTNIAKFVFTNNSTGSSTYPYIDENGTGITFAIGFPSYIAASSVALDAANPASGAGQWQTATCPSSFGSTFRCFLGPRTLTGSSCGASTGCLANGGATATLYLDIPEPVSSFSLTSTNDLTVQAYGGNQYSWFTLSTTGATQTTPDGQYSVDSLGIGAYSLNGDLMSAAFTPNVVGTGQSPTPFALTFTNTSTSADPFPDSVDAIVLEQSVSNTYTVNGTPTFTSCTTTCTNWAYKTFNNPSGNKMDYYFGICGTPATSLWPPETRSMSVPLAAAYPAPTPCSPPETQALRAGYGLTMNFKLNGTFSAGSMSWNMYAHGVNGGGWSEPKSISVTLSSESASAGFSSVAGSSVATNAQPTLTGAAPQTFIYTFNNTSATGTNNKIFKITLPGTDVNGSNAYDGSANGYWNLVTPISSTIVLGGTGLSGSGCSVNTGGSNTFSPTIAGANGQIEVDCSTGIAPTKTLTVQFQSYYPSTQNDSYQFPSTVDGFTTGQTWIGDQTILVSFSVGLTIVVNPSNPGPGGSTPSVSCTQCAFSGSTIDFGVIGNKTTVTGTDVVRASVIYAGSSSINTWQLSVSASSTVPCTSGGGYTCPSTTSELTTSMDTGAFPTTVGGGACAAITVPAGVTSPTFAAVPTGTLNLASAPETSCSKGYDTIQSYQVGVGTETVTGNILTITYTLIVN